MKKFMFILVALIGFGISANAQDFCDEKGNYIKFYPKRNSGDVYYFDEEAIQMSMSVKGNFINKGKCKFDKKATKTSDGSYYVIKFYDKDESTPSFYGKLYSNYPFLWYEDELEPTFIEILEVTIERKK
jgi:hypothetical protein